MYCSTTVDGEHVIAIYVVSRMVIYLTSPIAAQDDPCLKYGVDINFLGASCADIYTIHPTSHGRSGYYVLKTDHLLFAYCDMELARL